MLSALLRLGTYATLTKQALRKLGLMTPSAAERKADHDERQADRDHAAGYNHAVSTWMGLVVGAGLFPQFYAKAGEGIGQLLKFETDGEKQASTLAPAPKPAAEVSPAPAPETPSAQTVPQKSIGMGID